MTTVSNTTSILKGRVVSLERINMDNAAADRCRKNYNITYRYDPDSLPVAFEVSRFCEYDKSDKKEVAILQNAVRCLKAMWLDGHENDTAILDEYANDTLLTFDYDTGKTLFDEETFQKDSDEYKNKQRALVAEYNKIVESSTLLNAIENAKKLQQIKDKIVELKAAEPKKDDAKYNHPEIVKGTTSVKQALDRYNELCDLRNKYKQEWEQYEIDYKHSQAGKLDISDDAFRVFKELYKANVFTSNAINRCAFTAYESVKDYNENNWKAVTSFKTVEESKKFLNQKPLKLWKKYGHYTNDYTWPYVVDWMMYDHFNDTDLMWLNALKAFIKRVVALKRIEEQHTDACEQNTDVCEKNTSK